MKKENFILGLDLGVGSIGWSCMALDEENEPKRILDLGSRIFAAENGSMEDRRNARGLRRVLRRRKARVKQTKALFTHYSYLEAKKVNGFFDFEYTKYDDPYHLKVKGLTEKLTMEELLICLVHYSKNRGFKSNRKNKEEGKDTKAASEEQKLLFSIQYTEKLLKEKELTISKYMISDPQFQDKKRNTDGEFKIGITRAMIVDEVTLLLEKQVELALVSEEFKNDYLRILTKQLSFSSGPETGPYHDPLNKMIGTCIFDGEDRAPSTSVSYERFTLVQKLQSISYSEPLTGEVKTLNTSEIKTLMNEAEVGCKTITYDLVQRVIGHPVIFRGLTLSRRDYTEIAKLRTAKPELSLDDAKHKQKLSREIFKMKNTNELTKNLKKLGYENTDVMTLDCISNLLSRYKADDEINQAIERDDVLSQESDDFKHAILQLDEGKFKEFGKLSFHIIRSILPLMIEDNLNYSDAMKACGFNHTNVKKAKEEFEKLLPMKQMFDELDKTVTNRCVVATLNEARKVVNAVINTYGKPYAIHVEVARELTKNDKEKNDMIEQQLSNQVNNTTQKIEIYKKYRNVFTSVDKVSRNDLIKYRLFIEQKGICPYTLAKTNDEQKAKIIEKHLFSDDYEIDHIMPYSMSFNDTFENKTLVFTAMNREKGDRLPYRVFAQNEGYPKFAAWVKLTISSQKKQEAYLAKEFTDEMKDNFSARALNDTRYATKTICEVLRYSFPSIKIKSFTGQITDKLKGVWGLKNLTHSYQNASYVCHEEKNEELEAKYQELSTLLELNELESIPRRKELKMDIIKIEKKQNKKNRSNHLHHALDATIIACATDSLRRRVEMHESYIRQRTHNKIAFRNSVYDEVTDSTREEVFERFSVDYNQLFDLTKNVDPRRFPMPYMSFKNEIILRLYERKTEVMVRGLKGLANYDDGIANACKSVLISHQCSRKSNSRLHKATIMGVAPHPVNKDEVVLTNRIKVSSQKFDKAKLEKIYDKEVTQKAVYDAVAEWLGSSKNGEEAIKMHKGVYPKNANGNEIKKVKLDYDTPKEEILIHKDDKQFVEKENVVQIHVFKKEGSDKLHFIGMDRYRVLNFKNDPNIIIWWGRDKNNKKIKYSDLKKEGYVPYIQLYKDEIIELELNNGSIGLCKVIGFSSGQFEIDSILGDGIDLISCRLQNNCVVQYKVSISTIKSIKTVPVNVLGKCKYVI